MKCLNKWLAVAACLGLFTTGAAMAEPVAAVDIVLKDDAKCTSCHDEADAPDILKIGQTRHGTRADKRTPTCVSCHGDSNDHTNYQGSGKPPKPDIAFGKKSKQTSDEKNAACSSCHQGGKQIHWSASAHASRDVSCTSCHTAHGGKDKVLNKRTQAEVCYTCHKQQRADASKPSHHPIPEGKMTCSDCHNSHGSAGQKSLIKDTTNATCFTCHAEKRGPFLHNHQPVVEDCANCHNPHGTTAENMLKSRMPFLCQQCHGNSSHPGNIPGIRSNLPNAISTNIGPGMAQARGCVNCHTNIHGSNGPSNATSGGAFRFFR
jgi:DmsE family decaheme c-type cytochrome